jgi:hypothetical protein
MLPLIVIRKANGKVGSMTHIHPLQKTNLYAIKAVNPPRNGKG